MNDQSLWIPGPMPGLNDVIKACNVADWGGHGKRWNRYNEMKQAWSHEVILYARQSQMRCFAGNYFTFVFAERNRQRDPDNFISGAMKIIFDAFVACGLISRDGWKNVHGIATYWRVDKDRPGVFVTVTSAATLADADAIVLWQKQKTEEGAQNG